MMTPSTYHPSMIPHVNQPHFTTPWVTPASFLVPTEWAAIESRLTNTRISWTRTITPNPTPNSICWNPTYETSFLSRACECALDNPPPHWGSNHGGSWVKLAWRLLRNTTWIIDPLPRKATPFEVAVLPHRTVDFSRLPTLTTVATNQSLAELLTKTGHILVATDGAYKEDMDISFSGYVVFSSTTLPVLGVHAEGLGGDCYVAENLALQRALTFLLHAFLPALSTTNTSPSAPLPSDSHECTTCHSTLHSQPTINITILTDSLSN